MAAGDYTIEVTVGSWTVTLDKGDIVDPASDAIAVDPLNATWSLTGPYPAQPTPTTCSFGLYVPDIVTGPTPVQGDRVEVVITTPDAALPGVKPVLDFVGLISDLDATVLADGLLFNIVATDYTSTLSEERVGDTPWPAEQRYGRLQRAIAASSLGLVVNTAEANEIVVAGLGPAVAARDIDSQPTRQVLDDILPGGVIWMGGVPSFHIIALATWVRPIIGQSVDGAGVVQLPIVFLPGGLPDLDAALPYRLSLAGGTLHMVRKAITPDSSLLAWIPSDAIDANSITWRQDKATNTNRVRIKAPGFLDAIGQPLAIGSVTIEYSDLVETSPNEITVQLDSDQTDEVDATDLAYALLGTHYDASPRWAVDSFVVIPEQIAAGDQWPRLFNPRAHSHVYDQAVGRFILVTDLADKWNLHDRGDYFGRLAGATLTLAAGEIRMTVTIAHRLPVGAGVESWYDTPAMAAFGPPVYTGPPTHHPITYAELAAGTNPTYAQCGDLTPADLELVEH